MFLVDAFHIAEQKSIKMFKDRRTTASKQQQQVLLFQFCLESIVTRIEFRS
jgi:hypothetical protein